jgi:hypothetical protein
MSTKELMPEYSVQYAIAYHKPHPMKEYVIKRNEWEKAPYNKEDDLEVLARVLEETLPKHLQCDGLTTLLLLEVIQEEKLEAVLKQIDVLIKEKLNT